MKGNPLSTGLQIIIFVGCFTIVSAQPRDQIGCQQRSTSGRSYEGEANTTVDGIPCQRWSDTEPHEHSFTHVGDHNFCRNPNGAWPASQVWCYTTDPEVREQNCSVPFCPTLKALDFSLDNDGKPDENNSSGMQKVADAADISVLFFQLVLIFGPFWVIFGPIWAILGHFWDIWGNFRSFLGHFLVLIFCGKICLCAI